VKEAGNKVEYIVGESVYQIPKSLVQEIVHSGNAVVQNDRSQRSPKSQASQSGCEGDPPNVDSRIPCHGCLLHPGSDGLRRDPAIRTV
jgi:hypothetical protein